MDLQHRQRTRSTTLPHGSRGSILAVVLIVMVVLALGLASYVNLNLGTARFARASYRQEAAFNLAEAGTEEALWSFNRVASGDTAGWQSWTTAGAAARRQFGGFDFGGGTTGNVKVFVDVTDPGSTVRPTVLALASVQGGTEPPSTRMIEVSLRRRSRFSAGLMAKDSIVFAGANASVDSWNSDPDNDPATAPIAYTSGIAKDGGGVASTSVDSTGVLINQANIWGYVATGGAAPQVGVNGSIRGVDTPADVRIDPNRVSTDFTADFPLVTAPVDGELLTSVGATLGTAGKATRWRTPGIVLAGNQTLTILGDVTLVLTSGSGASAISVTGNAEILIAENSSLTVYVEGDVRIGGRGLANPNVRPLSCLLFGTNASAAGQTIHLAGNGSLTAAVYAPNAAVTINGNGNIMGGVVAQSITLTGNAAFHFDESLKDFTDGMPFGVMSWRELTSAVARQPYLSKFNGW